MRRWLWPACVYAAITAVLTLPLLRQFGSAFPHDAGDPVLNTWILWWSTRAVPLTTTWWNAPMFYPATGVMALSEVLIGLLPISAPVQWLTGNPVAAYNAVFLLSFPLCGLAAYALALEVTGHRAAALAAGVAFAFAPYRIGQLAHVQMLAYFGAPAAIAALHAYVRSGRRRWLIFFGVAWLVQSLSNGYAMFHVGVLIALWIVWFARPLRLAMSIAVAWCCASLPLIPLLLTYERIHRSLHLARDINEIKSFSADLSAFFSAAPEAVVWGGRLLPAHNESAVFPGITVVALAAVAVLRAVLRRPPRADDRWSAGQRAAIAIAIVAALVAVSVPIVGPWAIGRLLTVSVFHKPFSIAMLAAAAAWFQSSSFRRAWRDRSAPVFYAAATIIMYVLALGPAPTAFEHPILYEPPYAWLMRLPGFAVLRVPARFAMVAALGQSVLVAIAVARWATLRRANAFAGVVVVGLMVDGAFRLPIADTPQRAFSRWAGVSAIVELPLGQPFVDFPAMYRSMFHRHPIVNGFSGYNPPHYIALAHALRETHDVALRELPDGDAIGIAFDASLPGADVMAARIAALPGTTRVPVAPGWTTFVLIPAGSDARPTGAAIPIVQAQASHHPEDAGRMLDGRVDTGWGSDRAQQGDEEVVIDLGAGRSVGALVLKMGAFAFGYPRMLAIEVSMDRTTWSPVWNGPTDVQTVGAALRDPGDVPVTIELGDVNARFLRLRQTGREPGIPWWIAELEVRRPASASAER